MKQTIPYLSLVTISFIFAGCTPAPTPSAPQVFENSPIKADTSTPSLGRPINDIPTTTTEVVNNTIVREPTQTTKTPSEVVTSVYPDIVKEETIYQEHVAEEVASGVDDAQIIGTPSYEANTEKIPAEVPINTLPAEDVTQSSKTPVEVDPYGNPPADYRTSIRSYLAKKANPNDTLKYVFSRPQKAEKTDKSWRGWMVKVDMLKRNGKGEILKNQPYTILFNGSSIVEDFASDNPKNITKVVY